MTTGTKLARDCQAKRIKPQTQSNQPKPFFFLINWLDRMCIKYFSSFRSIKTVCSVKFDLFYQTSQCKFRSFPPSFSVNNSPFLFLQEKLHKIPEREREREGKNKRASKWQTKPKIPTNQNTKTNLDHHNSLKALKIEITFNPLFSFLLWLPMSVTALQLWCTRSVMYYILYSCITQATIFGIPKYLGIMVVINTKAKYPTHSTY